MVDDSTRLKAAIATIHDHLHHDRINEAHEACECAMQGGEVSQPNLTLPDSAKVQVFAARFNELCMSLGVKAGFLALIPSATMPDAISFQCGGEVESTKLIESIFDRSSTFQGEHSS